MPASRFSQRLRELRTELGLVQDDIARIAGVSARGIASNWEQGKRTPDMEIQLRLADFFGVSLDYLHGRPRAHRDSPAVAAGKLGLRRDLMDRKWDMPPTPGELMAEVHALLQCVVPEAFPPDRIAAHLLISPEALQAAFAGRGQVSGDVIRRFAALAGLPAEWFYDPRPDVLSGALPQTLETQ